MEPRFIHLRIHTEYSLLDGIVQLQPLIEKAALFQMPALAVTDQSNLFAVVKFYQAAIDAGIKPIIGADIWLENEEETKQPYRCTLLCQNQQGYKHLLKLISQSFRENQLFGKAVVKREWLIELAEGLIVLSGASEGDVGHAVLRYDENKLKARLRFWQQTFPNRYYLELQRTGRAREEEYIQAILPIAETYLLPVVATNDTRFISASDFEAHEARVCIHEGQVLSDPKRPRCYGEQQYFRSQEEMEALFADIPTALQNTVEIAKRCNVMLTLGKYFLPHFTVPEGYTSESYLIESAKRGLDERLSLIFKDAVVERQVYDARLTHELDVIIKMGFAGYFLIVADFTQWARENDVPVGPGRGSGPGSLVAFSLKITDLDPLAHDLLFERFLNPERISMPDFDIDFCMEGRDRVIDYVMDKHGHENVAQIITYGTMAARAVVRDVGRVLGMPYGQVDKIAKLIPFELGMTLEKALEQEPLLLESYQKDDEIRTLIDLARKLEGITRNAGKHAGGVVIAPGKLTDFTALYCEADAPEHVVTQFDKDDVETIGLVKFDFLGLRTLTIIEGALKQLHEIDLHRIPMDDAKTYALLKACKTTAVFQLESRGMKDLVNRLQPDCFEDIVALVALFRPGPLQSGMVDDFINRKHGRAKVSYLHPKLEPILRPTYGVIVYQEQVMQIAQALAGYTLGAADLLRRAMGKKKAEEMALQRETFCKGAIERGVNLELATHIFDLMEKFAGYGFNKSHSASYALIAYQTAWLKAHYPAAYMAAVLSSDMDNTDKVVTFIDECAELGLQVDPPDINESDYTFKVINDKQLRYGLGAIKGAGQAAIETLVAARKLNGPFKDLADLCQRIDLHKVNKRVFEALIRSGSLDAIGPHRASTFASLTKALRTAEQSLRNKTLGQHDLFGNIILPTAFDYVPAPEWSEQERLLGEKETLGLYLSGHPIQRYSPELKHFVSDKIGELRPTGTKTAVIAGIVTHVKSIQTKRGDRMAVVTLEDMSGHIDMICFSENYQKFRELLVKDKLIIVTGEISTDEFNGGLRIMTREVLSIDEARERYAKYLRIQISAEQANDIQTLAPILGPHRGGKCPIKIQYQHDKAVAQLKLGESWRVKPTDALLQALQDMFSEVNVEVVYE
jgi:DNA polymerase III subunit alpha